MYSLPKSVCVVHVITMSVWSPNASETNIDKLQIVQDTALGIAAGCTHDTKIQHLHDETNVLPRHQHLQLHASQIKQKAQHPTHPLHKLTIYLHTPRLKKQTTFNNINYTAIVDTHPDTVTRQQISANSYINTPPRSPLPNSPSPEKHVAPSPNSEPIKVPF